MPTSVWKGIETFIEIVVKTKADSFLDIGIGNGKWGYLFREYSDVWKGRHYKDKDWQSTVDGIEIYEPYIQDHQRAVYSNIHIGNAKDVIKSLGNYEIIMAGDVIEHLDKEDGIALINELKKKSTKALIVCIPLGNDWLRKSFNENKYESHLSVWEIDDLQKLGFNYYNVYLAADYKRKIGLFVSLKESIEIDDLEKLEECPVA